MSQRPAPAAILPSAETANQASIRQHAFCFDPGKKFRGHGVEGGVLAGTHGGEHGTAMRDDDESVVSRCEAERKAGWGHRRS
jgi:hypothetical protein